MNNLLLNNAINAILIWCYDTSTLPIGEKAQLTWYKNRFAKIKQLAELAREELDKEEQNVTDH